jgi:hypothetical protein
MACTQTIWVKNLLAKAKTTGNTALWKEVGLLAPQTICIDVPKLRIEMNQCGKPPGIYIYALKCGLHSGSVQGLVHQFLLENLPSSAYPQKKTMLANAQNPERDVSREPVMGSEMMSLCESRFGINSVSVRSITGPRGSMAFPKKPQPAKRKKSTLRGIINKAIYQIDQTVYSDDIAWTVDFSGKLRDELVVMKQGPELAMAQSQKVARDNSWRGTRLVSRKEGPSQA